MRGRRGATRRRLLVPAVLTLVVPLLAGCVDLGELEFTQDERLEFTAPDNNEQVQAPVTFTWTMRDFDVLQAGDTSEPSDDAGYFAIFIDRAPVRPGENLRAVAKGDLGCRPDDGCPNAQYLSSRGVYVSTEPSLVVDVVPTLTGNQQEIQQHQVTVVLVDVDGDRIGESSWFRYFKMRNLQVNL